MSADHDYQQPVEKNMKELLDELALKLAMVRKEVSVIMDLTCLDTPFDELFDLIATIDSKREECVTALEIELRR